MTPLAEVTAGDWIATVDGQIVARGATMEEVAKLAAAEGYEDFEVEKVTSPGTWIL